MNKPTHTPTPWTVGVGHKAYSKKCHFEIAKVGTQPPFIKLISGNLEIDGANAKFIVTACNHHDELVSFLKEIVDGDEYKIPQHIGGREDENR